MTDQAKKLRELARRSQFCEIKTQPADYMWRQNQSSTRQRVIAVSSGKGGVGKTNLVANLGIALAKAGKKVLILDADLGLANIDVLLDITPRYNLQHLIAGEKSMSDILIEGPHEMKIVPGGSGISELANLSDEKREQLISGFVELEKEAEITLIDTGAGISRNILSFILAAGEAFVITTPEPTAITDAYGLVKVLSREDPDIDIKLLVNMVTGESEANEIAERIARVSKKFLNKHVDTFGHIVTDTSVGRAVRKQEPFILSYPNCEAAQCINRLTTKLDNEIPETYEGQGFRGFLSRLWSRQ